MRVSRRDFCQLAGMGAGIPLLAPGWEWRVPRAGGEGPLRLDSNENPYGPSPAARAAMERALADGGRYPSTGALIAAIAAANGVAESNVLLTVGATEGLAIGARAFTGPDAPLVTAAPSYAAIATAAMQLGHPVIRVPIAADGSLDLGAMAARAKGAGLLYLCNPNNPTGTLVTGGALSDFVSRVERVSPATTIVVGEAYHEYIETPGYQSAVPLALESPRVVVNRTFSKLYGLAGMRLGYLIGQESTLKRVAAHRVPLGANVAAIAAAMTVLADEPERLRQRALNTAGRRDAERFFAGRGRRFYPAHANYLFVDIKRDVANFRAACERRGLLIGRPYPPADTWARITIGTPEEMRRALPIFEEVLAAG
jgi:histidinol-phosphate aminotransferase